MSFVKDMHENFSEAIDAVRNNAIWSNVCCNYYGKFDLRTRRKMMLENIPGDETCKDCGKLPCMWCTLGDQLIDVVGNELCTPYYAKALLPNDFRLKLKSTLISLADFVILPKCCGQYYDHLFPEKQRGVCRPRRCMLCDDWLPGKDEYDKEEGPFWIYEEDLFQKLYVENNFLIFNFLVITDTNYIVTYVRGGCEHCNSMPCDGKTYWKDVANQEITLIENNDEFDNDAEIGKCTLKYFELTQLEQKKTNTNKKLPKCMDRGMKYARDTIQKDVEELRFIKKFHTSMMEGVIGGKRKFGMIDTIKK